MRSFLALLSLMTWPAFTVAAPLQHDLELVLEPATAELRVTDRLTLPADPTERCFTLQRGLAPTLDGPVPLTEVPGSGTLGRYCLPQTGERFVLHYGGTLQATDPAPAAHAGLNLYPGSGWYPRFGETLARFRLAVDLPAGWRSVSQGERLSRTTYGGRTRETWHEPRPQDGLYLIAAPFHEYAGRAGAVRTLALLREPAPELAERYLKATARHLDFYNRLLGPYPYAKFALVENFWDSGYGMPSFTLLGPRVIRLPFIVETSYPHEILHNWWGNGVYVDPAGGNWSEGLTTYLADHLLAERQGRGAEHRRAALQRYADYVHSGRGFALSDFNRRHNEVSQSVGYDKGLMVFHMLRRELGDAAFIDG
ncbi:MAG: hypothetical protein R3202_15305, partial [Candidatus Competibacterales bacterium]|nr:hypothetical protein [Candidatus Competibacterales bacterium]